ncbi:MAG: hypothetical protein ACT4ON_07155 [Bacteroidota bacterium]
MSQGIWEILSVFLLSTVKFVFGAVPLALGLGFSFFETVFITSIGGFVGVLTFVFLSDFIIKRIKERIQKKYAENPNRIPNKKFTKKNKTIVYVKNKFGIIGICLLTPLLLSIPLGCLLAVRYFNDKQKIIAYMFGSILFWSVSIASFKLFF